MVEAGAAIHDVVQDPKPQQVLYMVNHGSRKSDKALAFSWLIGV